MAPYTRRHFLKSTAALAATSGAALAQAAAPSQNVHFALVGAGGQGCWDASHLLNVQSAKLTAICDINPSNIATAQKLAPEARVYSDWNELFAKETDLQAAIIALPEDTHAPATIAALESKLDVFCEKPMAYSLDQARAMIDMRDKNERILQIGQQRRSNPLYYLAERLLQKEGLIGEILRVEAFWDRWGDWKRPLPALNQDFSEWGYPSLNHLINWRLYRQYGHGLITENGTHQLDAASWLLGGKKASTVCGLGAIRYNDGRETHDLCSAEYLFDANTIVRFAQDFHQGFNYGWSYGELLLGSEGAMRITAEQDVVLYDRERRETRVSIAKLGDCDIAGVNSTIDELQTAESDRAGGGLRTFSYSNQMRIFARCIRERTSPSCTGEIGHNALVFTLTGAEAQYQGETKELAADLYV